MYLQEDPVYSEYYNSVSSQRTNATNTSENNRNSYSTHDSDNSNETDEGFYIDPEWDDMVTFRQLKLPIRSSHASLLDTLDETSSLLGVGGFHSGHQRRISSQSFLVNPHDFWQRLFLNWSSTMVKRNLLLVIFPVFVVAVWCAVPLVNTIKDDVPVIRFWFFLFFYYGFYNFIALFMISQYFHLYSLNWWPKTLGSNFSMFMLWSLSMIIGSIMYYTTDLYKSPTTWVLLTFCTLHLPLIYAFISVRKETRNSYRQSLSYAQKLFMYATENRLPSSYKRFLWFCATFLLSLSALVLGQAYATYYTIHGPNKLIWWHPLIYNYTWTCIVFSLDAISDYIVEFKIRSWALTYTYRLYYSMIYFIFYRNLFFQLRSKNQFLVIQCASSLWVIINYPARMSLTFFKITQFFGNSRTYENHCRNVGRSFFIRNLTENVTMLAFLSWTNILYWGANFKFYRVFDSAFKEKEQYYFFSTSSVIIWIIELLCSYITRMIFKKVYNHSITREAVNDFIRYPEVIWVLMLVIIHVLQDMLFALIRLESLK